MFIVYKNAFDIFKGNFHPGSLHEEVSNFGFSWRFAHIAPFLFSYWIKYNWSHKAVASSYECPKAGCSSRYFLTNTNHMVTDGYYSVHMMVASDMDVADNENGRNDSEENLTHYSVIETIFTGEKIQDLVPLEANGFLILGQVHKALREHRALEDKLMEPVD